MSTESCMTSHLNRQVRLNENRFKGALNYYCYKNNKFEGNKKYWSIWIRCLLIYRNRKWNYIELPSFKKIGWKFFWAIPEVMRLILAPDPGSNCYNFYIYLNTGNPVVDKGLSSVVCNAIIIGFVPLLFLWNQYTTNLINTYIYYPSNIKLLIAEPIKFIHIYVHQSQSRSNIRTLYSKYWTYALI